MLQECGCMMFTQSPQNGLQEKSHDKLLTVSRLGIHLKLLRNLFFYQEVLSDCHNRLAKQENNHALHEPGGEEPVLL